MAIAIRVEHLSKEYRLGIYNRGMLFKDIQSWMARRQGRPDPHERIGATSHENSGDRFWALKDLSFDIAEGDRVGIIGKNGAGKSTLLKILSRITAPTEGTIKIKGRVTSLLEIGTGFHGELTGRENIYLNGAILGMKKRQIDRRLDEIIAFSEIEEHIDTPVKRYSSGMYVRLAFAVAAHLESEILIADEVLAVGDATFQKKALGKMNDLSSGQGRTVLFVSHQIPAVVALCNKGMFLEKGQLIKTNSLDECVDLYMNGSDKTAESALWKGSEGDENLQLNMAGLTSAYDMEHHMSTYNKGDKILLRIAYEMLTTQKNIVLCVEIFNKKGQLLCVNSATDSMEPEQRSKLGVKGKHELQLEIDGGLFASGHYYIKFDFAIHNIKRIINDTPTLMFEIIDREENISQFSELRHNIIYPRWKWTHDR